MCLKQWVWRELRAKSWKLSSVDDLVSQSLLKLEFIRKSPIGLFMALLVL
jgi:hypothetical protein